MIGVIGFQDEVIGLGLSGVSRMVEVNKNISKAELIRLIESINEVETWFISEKLLEMIRKDKDKFHKFFIEIPENFNTKGLEKIDALARETLGISLH